MDKLSIDELKVILKKYSKEEIKQNLIVMNIDGKDIGLLDIKNRYKYLRRHQTLFTIGGKSFGYVDLVYLSFLLFLIIFFAGLIVMN